MKIALWFLFLCPWAFAGEQTCYIKSERGVGQVGCVKDKDGVITDFENIRADRAEPFKMILQDVDDSREVYATYDVEGQSVTITPSEGMVESVIYPGWYGGDSAWESNAPSYSHERRKTSHRARHCVVKKTGLYKRGQVIVCAK